jgi:hypothetical protein
MNAARHVIDCEACKFNHLIMIGFRGQLLTDHFRPGVKFEIPGAPSDSLPPPRNF